MGIASMAKVCMVLSNTKVLKLDTVHKKVWYNQNDCYPPSDKYGNYRYLIRGPWCVELAYITHFVACRDHIS